MSTGSACCLAVAGYGPLIIDHGLATAGSVKAYGWMASKIKGGGGGANKGPNSQLSGH